MIRVFKAVKRMLAVYEQVEELAKQHGYKDVESFVIDAIQILKMSIAQFKELDGK